MDTTFSIADGSMVLSSSYGPTYSGRAILYSGSQILNSGRPILQSGRVILYTGTAKVIKPPWIKDESEFFETLRIILGNHLENHWEKIVRI